MTEPNHVRVNLGSKSDAPLANILLKLLRDLGVRCGVSIASCHWGAGKAFDSHIGMIKEDIIVGIGGMSFAAAGLIAALDRNTRRTKRITFAVPLDKAAQSAVEDLPPGTPVITCGYNRTDVKASIINSALAIAKIVARTDPVVEALVEAWFASKMSEKAIVREVDLENGLIPIEEKKS